MKSSGFKSEMGTEWKMIAMIGLGGMLFGFAAAASNRALTHHVAPPVLYVQSSQVNRDDNEEAAKLATRYRRLRAFSEVLRQRAREHKQQQLTGSGE